MKVQSTFIDWIYMAQRHYGELPIVGDGVRVRGESFEQLEVDGEKFLVVRPGEEIRYSIPSAQKRGSHDTSMRLRCDGNTVQLSGNMGRFERPDNVWNYGLEQTVEKANAFLHEFELPPFFAGEEFMKDSVSKRDYELGLLTEWTGGVLRELHTTRNYMVGNEPLACEAMRYIGGHRAARIAKGVYGDESIVFGKLGKGFHKAIVVYRKAAEMLAHARGEEAKARVKQSQEYQFAQDLGLIRVECKWGNHFLRDHGLRYLGAASMAKIISLFDAETEFLLNASPDQAARVVSDMPTKLRSAALHWIRGDDLRGLMARATYFRTVKALKDYGIDASEPRRKDNSGEKELQALLDRLPRFELRELAPPEWYGLPEVARAA